MYVPVKFLWILGTVTVFSINLLQQWMKIPEDEVHRSRLGALWPSREGGSAAATVLLFGSSRLVAELC